MLVLDVGSPLAPGVSWLAGRGPDTSYNFVLKCGNFGDDDLFTTAWKELNG